MNAVLAGAVLTALVAGGGAPTAPPSSATTTVHVRDFHYLPPLLAVAPGTVVRFVNDDAEAHTVTATDRSYDSAGLDTGDAWSHAFVKPGRYAYYCALHPFMKGTIVVVAAPAAGAR